MKSKLWMCLIAAALLAPGAARAQLFGPIFDEVPKTPSKLLSAFNRSPKPAKKFTYIGCYDAFSGTLQDCGFDLTITGLKPPEDQLENNGGHAHGGTHPVGEIEQTEPFPTAPSTVQAGQTFFQIVEISHDIPEVSGKIDTVLNLRVPEGWHTVSPQPCDTTFTSWCFFTTIDVGVSGLTLLPDGSPFYRKARKGVAQHPNAAAYSATADAISKLTRIAQVYQDLTLDVLSINDLSLLKGGLFDVKSDYLAPHTWHRIGTSADINKPEGQDCRNADALKDAVAIVMPAEAGTFFVRRPVPSSGRFLCETANNNNIHLDFDVR